MPWTLKNTSLELDQLQPHVKEKALEIARKLIEEQNWPEEKAIKEAITRAEEWGIDEAG